MYTFCHIFYHQKITVHLIVGAGNNDKLPCMNEICRTAFLYLKKLCGFMLEITFG